MTQWCSMDNFFSHLMEVLRFQNIGYLQYRWPSWQVNSTWIRIFWMSIPRSVPLVITSPFLPSLVIFIGSQSLAQKPLACPNTIWVEICYDIGTYLHFMLWMRYVLNIISCTLYWNLIGNQIILTRISSVFLGWRFYLQ